MARGTVLRHFLISPTELLWSQHKLKVLQPEQTPEASQVSSTGRCCSWSGRWSCSLPATGRPCRWGRHTPHRWCEPGPPERVTAHRCQAGGRPVECCWRPGKSGEEEQGYDSQTWTEVQLTCECWWSKRTEQMRLESLIPLLNALFVK